MPRLPDAQSLGQRPTPSPETGIVQAPQSHMGDALSHLGDAIQEIDARLTKARRAADLTDALGKATEALSVRALDYSRDQDFKTAPQRFKDEAASIVESNAAGIQDKMVQDVFRREIAKTVLAKRLGVLQSSAKQEADYHAANLDDTLTTLARSAAQATSDLDRANILNQARISIGENVKAGWITDVHGSKLQKVFEERLDQAVVMALINTDPATAAQKLAGNKDFPNLDPVKREELLRVANVRDLQAQAQADKANKEFEKERREGLFQQFAARKLTPQMVAQSQASTEVKEHYLRMIRTQAREDLEAPIRTNPKVALELFRRIKLPYGEDGKITSPDAIDEAYMSRQLSFVDHERLRSMVQQDRGDDGDTLKRDVEAVRRMGERAIKASPIFIMQEAAAEDAALRFSHDLESKVSEYRKANKDPRLLLIPGSPDFFADPKRIQSYLPGRKDAVAAKAETASGATNAKGWKLMTDAKGNKAYVSPDGKQFEEVK